MRVLILSDIHSNLEAFQSILDDADSKGGFDEIWSLGDLVGYGPDPSECIKLIRQYEGKNVAGNHDLAAVGELELEAFNPYAKAAIEWTTSRLSKDEKTFLINLPLTLEVEDFTVVHGSPRDPIWEYLITPPSAAANFNHFSTLRCLVGHSHIPFICRPQRETAVFHDFPLDEPLNLGSDRLIINPGGVGQPRDGDPRTNYAIYQSKDAIMSHHKVEYDIPKTQKKMADRGLPKYLADRLAHGR